MEMYQNSLKYSAQNLLTEPIPQVICMSMAKIYQLKLKSLPSPIKI